MGIMNWLFGCRHKDLSRAFTAEDQTYKVCLKCGAHLRYSWQTMSLVSEKSGGNPEKIASGSFSNPERKRANEGRR